MTDTDLLRRSSSAAPWWRPTPVDAAPRRLVAAAVAAGLALELGARGGPSNTAVSIGTVLALAALVIDGRVARSGARRLVAAAAVPALLLSWRASPWLAASNLAAVAALVSLGVLHARSGSVLDTTPRRLLGRTWPALGRALSVRQVLGPVAPEVGSTGAALRVARGAAVALPLVVVMVALLASGDAVFATLVVPDVGAGPALQHVFLSGLLAVGVLALAAVARGDDDDVERTGSFGAVEVTTMLALAAAVVALFVVSQVVAATGTGQRLIESSGLTPAEHARGGFFQLCWATGVLVALLGLVRAFAAPGVMARGVSRILATAVPALALGLVAVSLRRMALYDQAFGLTMLRIWVVLGAVWLGTVLLMTAARNLGVRADRSWLVAGAASSACLLLLVANVADPEALVVRRNVERASAGAELDAGYLRRLSADALPALADELASVRDPVVAEVLASAVPCEEPRGAAALNLAVARARDLRRLLCGGAGSG